jgi:PPOX class probable F420-dependent enzyme
MTNDGVTLPDEALALLDRPLTAVICTVNPDGSPQASVVWFERRGQQVVLFATDNAIKVRNLRRDPRVEVIVADIDIHRSPGVPMYLRLIGTAEVLPSEPDIADRLAVRYGNPDGFPYDLGPHVNIHITPTRFGGLGPFRGGSSGEWVRKDGGS